MTKYRKASEKTISRGKGKSTDQLSLAEAKDYFNARAKDTGAKKFRWGGEVYDLSGNKVAQGTSRSAGGSSSARSSAAEGPKRPKARPEVENLADPKGTQWSHLNDKPKPSKPREANAAVVGAMGAAAVGAGIAAARTGRTKTTGGGNAATGRLAPPPARLALPAPTRGGTVTPPSAKPKALPAPKPEAKPKPSAKPKAGAKPRGGAGRAVGANPGRRIGRPGGSNSKGFQLPDILDLKNM